MPVLMEGMNNSLTPFVMASMMLIDARHKKKLDADYPGRVADSQKKVAGYMKNIF